MSDKSLHSYKATTKTGRLTDYSGKFNSLKEANEWYNEHGKWLENMFNRKLVLVKGS